MTPLDLVRLTPLMARTGGRPDLTIGVIDGPVAMPHPALAAATIRTSSTATAAACSQASSAACQHGTFVAGMLGASRGSTAPAICPDCPLLVRPIFAEATSGPGDLPHAPPEELAAAILECLEAGARLLNLSVALAAPASPGVHALEAALDCAANAGVITVAAAGNQSVLGSSVITRHPGVIPVAACDLRGRPLPSSNLGHSIGRRGLRAPGEHITSLGAEGEPLTWGGTSVATPFVTGAVALVWSAVPAASAGEVRAAVVQAGAVRRTTVVPPLLDAWAAYLTLRKRGPV